MKNWPINTGREGVEVMALQTGTRISVSNTTSEAAAEDVLIDNPGPNDVFVAAGNDSVAATELSVRVPAGSLQPFRKATATHLSVRTRPGFTQRVVVHVGEGQ